MLTAKKTYWLMVLFSMLGFIDSAYLTWIKLTSNKSACLPGLGDCWSVNTSRYSEFYGIPVAIIGAGGYLVLVGILLLEKALSQHQIAHYIEFGLTFAGTLFSVYLTYIEIAVLKAICPFCVVSALLMTALFVCSIIRLKQEQMGQYS